jgi:hypothetical protein
MRSVISSREPEVIGKRLFEPFFTIRPAEATTFLIRLPLAGRRPRPAGQAKLCRLGGQPLQ